MFSLEVSSSAPSASGGAVRVGLVSVLPASLTLDEFDLLRPSCAVAGGVEEEEGSSDESLDTFIVRIGDGKGDVSERRFWGGHTTFISPVRSFHEDGRREEGVGGAESVFHVGFGDWDESTVGEFKTLRGAGGGFCDPSLDRDTSDHNVGPFHGFHEDRAFATFGEGTEDGLLHFVIWDSTESNEK